jgi:acid phosphatase family membrane protein YuiD
VYAEGARLVTPDHARMHMCECGTTPSCSSSVNRSGATGLGNTAAFTTDHTQPYQFLVLVLVVASCVRAGRRVAIMARLSGK